MIPETKQPVVKRALSEAFGVTDFDDIRPVKGGLSPSLVFRMVVQGSPYLLRIILRSEQIADPRVELACMKTAADAGIAPRIWYSNLDEKLLITDFVEAKPFPDDMALQIAPLLRRLHALPGFSKPRTGSYISVMNGFVQRFQLAHLLPEAQTEMVFRRFAEIQKVYPQDEAELVASHNDLKPQNIRYDGARPWLVDWESAFLNDPYVDLAVVANFFVKDSYEEEAYLTAYFGEPAGAYRIARFFLMRQMVSMFYAAFLMAMVDRKGLSIGADMSAPDFREYHRRLIADEGEVEMATAEGQLQYAKVHLIEARRNMQSEQFDEALAQVRASHTGQ